MNESILYVCRTYYNIYATIIRVLAKKEKADLLIDDYRRRNLPELTELILNLKQAGVFKHIYYYHAVGVETVGTNGDGDDVKLHISHENALLGIPLSLINDKNYQAIIVYNDWDGEVGDYLRKTHLHYTLSESSVNAFRIMHKTTPRAAKFYSTLDNDIYKDESPLGRSRFCDRIEVSSVDGVPSYVKQKSKIINIQGMLENLDKEQKEIIKEIFLNNTELIERIKEPGEKVLLLTRPYVGSDRWLPSMEVQGKLLTDVINDYAKDSLVFIKPHPRDRFDYSTLEVLGNVELFPRCFPVEVLNLLECNCFDAVVSVGEECLSSLSISSDTIYLDLSWFREVRKKYCTEEELMELNQF